VEKYSNYKLLIHAVIQDTNEIGIVSFHYDVPQVDEATIYFTAGKATDDNVTQAHCMLFAKGYKHTLSICMLFHCSNGCASLLCYTYSDCLVLKGMAYSFGIFSHQFCAFIRGGYIN